MSIKSILDNLEPGEKRRLVHAFDNGFSQYVELENNRYVGVNIGSAPNFKILETAGVWSYGEKS